MAAIKIDYKMDTNRIEDIERTCQSFCFTSPLGRTEPKSSSNNVSIDIQRGIFNVSYLSLCMSEMHFLTTFKQSNKRPYMSKRHKLELFLELNGRKEERKEGKTGYENRSFLQFTSDLPVSQIAPYHSALCIFIE